ncbi:hypothetical protein [Streptomyces sp. MBT62]|uniref:hypothetical protein n=1 Tax=Streptomyces sp. MBT62 TaxID=2800410 RepID=UPI00190C162D|nr:hypothetical protein [Streptomyces sp. MBT62]MBK3570243.1 hypothetical protein [Streptomyces sp. MBT62]
MNDSELLTVLRDADPAFTSRAPLPDINRLVEAAMTAMKNDSVATPEITHIDIDTTNPTAKITAGKGRRRLLGLAAAAALLLGGGVTAGITANSGNGHATEAVKRLSLSAAHTGNDKGNGKCQAPVPDQLAGYPTLFYGTVTSVKGPLITFHVDHWLRGGGPRTILVSNDPDFPENLTFTVGQHYIVAAEKDGSIPSCGTNWVSDKEWRQFSDAFGGK